MRASDKQIARQGFQRFFAARRGVGARFYEILFERDPELRPLFPADMHRQQVKVVQMVCALFRYIDQEDRIESASRHLALRHRAYGVRPEHFDLVGDVLLDALDERLPGGLSVEERAAWAAIYAWVSGVMSGTFEEPTQVAGARRRS